MSNTQKLHFKGYCSENLDNFETISQAHLREAAERTKGNRLASSGVAVQNESGSIPSLIESSVKDNSLPPVVSNNQPHTFFTPTNNPPSMKPSNKLDKPGELLLSGGIVLGFSLSALGILIALDIATLGLAGMILAGICIAGALFGLVGIAIATYGIVRTEPEEVSSAHGCLS